MVRRRRKQKPTQKASSAKDPPTTTHVGQVSNELCPFMAGHSDHLEPGVAEFDAKLA